MPVTTESQSERTTPLLDGEAEHQQARFERLISQAATDSKGEAVIKTSSSESGVPDMPFQVSHEEV